LLNELLLLLLIVIIIIIIIYYYYYRTLAHGHIYSYKTIRNFQTGNFYHLAVFKATDLSNSRKDNSIVFQHTTIEIQNFN